LRGQKLKKKIGDIIFFVMFSHWQFEVKHTDGKSGQMKLSSESGHFTPLLDQKTKDQR